MNAYYAQFKSDAILTCARKILGSMLYGEIFELYLTTEEPPTLIYLNTLTTLTKLNIY